MRRYGEVGTFHGPISDFTFMVAAPVPANDPLYGGQEVFMVFLLEVPTELLFMGRRMEVGDIGPVREDPKQITWWDQWPE